MKYCHCLFSVSNKSPIWFFSIEIKQELCLIVALCHPKRGCIPFTRDVHVCVITMYMSVLSARDICSQTVRGHKLIPFIQLLMLLTFLVFYARRPVDLKTEWTIYNFHVPLSKLYLNLYKKSGVKLILIRYFTTGSYIAWGGDGNNSTRIV